MLKWQKCDRLRMSIRQWFVQRPRPTEFAMNEERLATILFLSIGVIFDRRSLWCNERPRGIREEQINCFVDTVSSATLQAFFISNLLAQAQWLCGSRLPSVEKK